MPKAHTPFQWDGQITRDEIGRRQRLLREHMPRKGVDLSWHDAETSFLEAVLARGDRSLADAIEAAWRAGAAFDAWTERFSLGRWLDAFERCGIDAAAVASRPFTVGGPLPWAHIDSGISEAFLRLERERAERGETTEDCTFGECTGCGVCTPGGPDIIVQAEGGRRG